MTTDQTNPDTQDICLWELMDAPFVYDTSEVHTFIKFLTDPKATKYELMRLGGATFTIVIHGESGSVVFEKKLVGLTTHKREELCEALKEHPKGMDKAFRMRLSGTMRRYLGLGTD